MITTAGHGTVCYAQVVSTRAKMLECCKGLARLPTGVSEASVRVQDFWSQYQLVPYNVVEVRIVKKTVRTVLATFLR